MTQMAHDENTETQPAGRVRRHGSSAYGKGPLLAGGVIAAILIPALVMGGIGAATGMTSIAAANSAQRTEAPPTPTPGNEVPGSEDPATPPDRASDQTVVPPHEDTIYNIQEGDTLTALSARFGMSVDSIAAYNAVRDVNVISEGAALRVPFIYVPPAG